MAKAGYDFTVYNKILTIWNLTSAPNSGVLLKCLVNDPTNNILLINPEGKIGLTICNEVKVNAGQVKDHISEGNSSDLVGVNCTLSDDSVVRAVGNYSIKAAYSGLPPEIHWRFPLYDYSELDYSTIPTDTCTIWVLHNTAGAFGQKTHKKFIIWIKDTNGTLMAWTPTKSNMTDLWTKQDFILGFEAPIDNQANNGAWSKGAGPDFNWHIVDLWVEAQFNYSNESGNVWVDGLELPSKGAYAIAKDATSIATYGHSMIPLSRPDIKSQLQLQVIAENELANRKDPVHKLSLTCTFQPALLYSGYTVDVLVPDAYIGTIGHPVKYRIISIKHIAEPGVNLCRGHDAVTLLELVRHDSGVSVDGNRVKMSSSPQDAINVSLENRVNILEKTAGSGGFGGGVAFPSGLARLSIEDILTLVNVAIWKDSGNYIDLVWDDGAGWWRSEVKKKAGFTPSQNFCNLLNHRSP